MNLIWGHKGPYFHAPCQRDRFPSVLDEIGETGDKLVAHLGISNMPDMGARLKRGRPSTMVAEQRAAFNMKESQVQPHKMFHTSSMGLRRGVDKYTQLPKFDPYVDESTTEHGVARDLLQQQRRLSIRPNSIEPAQRQEGELPYTGNCQHCRRRGSNDVANDFQGRLYLQQAHFLGQINFMMIDGQPDPHAAIAAQRNRNHNHNHG